MATGGARIEPLAWDGTGEQRSILPRTRALAVADELRAAIHSGRLESGHPLRQTEIARQFRVSTTPVREALARLEQEGLVTRDAHRGAVVSRPTVEDLRQNYESRLALETFAAGIAETDMSETAFQQLAATVEEMRAEQDPYAYSRLNRQFHDTINAASGRPQLTALIGDPTAIRPSIWKRAIFH
jgi:DNA-binding GntR family transcriptional regulator